MIKVIPAKSNEKWSRYDLECGNPHRNPVDKLERDSRLEIIFLNVVI
jgi:hypothetical protein